MPSRVTARWIGDLRFQGRSPEGHTITLAPKPEEEEGVGFNPMEMLLLAMAGCTGMDVVNLLQKKRQDIKGLTVEITGEKRKKLPYTWDTIHVRYVVEGEVSEKAVEQAISLSMEKYCSVGIMLGARAKISHEYVVIGKPFHR